MIVNLFQCTWYTYGATGHHDVGITQHRGHLITAVETGHDMTAGDFYPCVAFHLSGLLVPASCLIGEVTGAAAEDVAVEGTSAGSHAFSTLSIIAAGSFKLIIERMVCVCHDFAARYFFAIQPTVAFGQGVGKASVDRSPYAFIRDVIGRCRQMSGSPFSGGIATVHASVKRDVAASVRQQDMSVTNLAVAADSHACIA